MKNIKILHKDNSQSSYINKVSNTPTQSPIIMPVNVETPLALQGEIEVVSGTQIFEYTDVEAGEFKIVPTATWFGHLHYTLAPESAEGELTFLLYVNDVLSERFDYDIVHTGSTPDVGTIEFFIHIRESTDRIRIAGYTTTENIIFKDVVNSNSGEVETAALTMVIELG